MITIQELFTDEIFHRWNKQAGEYEDQEYYILKFNGEPVFYTEVPDDEGEHYQFLHGRQVFANKLKELFGTEVDED